MSKFVDKLNDELKHGKLNIFIIRIMDDQFLLSNLIDLQE